MNRSALLLGVASVLAGTTALLVVLGAVYNPILVVLAAPFGAAAYFLWIDATDRLDDRWRARAAADRARRAARNDGGRAAAGARRRRRGGKQRDPDGGPGAAEARRILGVDADADQGTIRRAYRDRVKEVHPDADDGDEEAFKRVTDAYERLRE